MASAAGVEGCGIDEKDSRPRGCRCNRKRAEPHRPSAIVGYRASTGVTIRCGDVGKLANVIDTLVGAGANEIGRHQFSW